MRSDEKKCPQCAETVKYEAKVCRYCAYQFSKDEIAAATAPKTMPKWLAPVGLVVALVLVTVFSVDADETASPVRYNLKEGDSYGYVAALSEDEKEAGQAVGDIHMFKYLGEKKGVHEVGLLDSTGAVSSYAECSNPCEFITLRDGDSVDRMQASGTLLGSVFEDAFAGHLKVAKE